MLEIVKVIVEILKGGLNGATTASELNDKKRRRELGVELATFYIELCRIIAAAKSIVSSLEVYSQRMGTHIKDGSDEYALTAGSWIKRDVLVQKVNIARLSQSAKRLESILVLVHHKSGLELRVLLHGKINALDSIYTLLSRGELPLEALESEKLSKLEKSENFDFDQEFEIKYEIKSSLNSKIVTTGQPWGIDTYESVSEYLDTRKPYSVIDKLEKLAEELRKTLEENFTLADILLDVRDSRHADGSEELLW